MERLGSLEGCGRCLRHHRVIGYESSCIGVKEKPVLEHGGSVRKVARELGVDPKNWLDLSTGINPLGWRVPEIPALVWNRLPENEDGLEDAAKLFYGCRHLLPAAGSQAIIQTLPRLRRGGSVGIVAPTYAEHAHAWRKEGFDVVELEDVSLSILDQLSVLVVVNPNNPTARLIPKATLLSWWRRLQAHGGWLVVDEAFMDADAGESLSGDTGGEGLLVLRSIGKFFGLAGARVGFLLGSRTVLEAAQEYLGPWNVAGPARWVATAALTDHHWHIETRNSLAHKAQRLTHLLGEHGLIVAAKTALFQWVPNHDAMSWWERMARSGVLVRRFDHPRGLRFGLPGDESQWHRLSTVLTSITPDMAHSR
ncbi:MAG: threonine-phosphate decarboxylase [Nitrospirae bacterium]|nr:threonine-phosphate decarboxylase [Magnetococcales bacterium]HAT50039.1 threonine-phosphate decarboxylase [Alphaproteobacteria bacterium]